MQVHAPVARVFDFTEVASPLKAAGSEVLRFATVIHNGYAGYNTLLYRVTVEAGQHAMLCVDAHTLAHDWFGVRATLNIGREEALCAAWTFSDALRSPLDASKRPVCIRCLSTCGTTDDKMCKYADVTIQQIPLMRLKRAVVTWIKTELPDLPSSSRLPAATRSLPGSLSTLSGKICPLATSS